jgi:hypothetical protein
MGYSSRQYNRPKPDQRPWKIHPIWRGIGCFMLILLPIMAYVAQHDFWRNTTWFPLPADLIQPVAIPTTGISEVNAYIIPVNNLIGERIYYADLFFFFIFLLLGFGLLSMVYGVFYRIVGPPRYGRYDAPPEKVRRRY